MDEDEPWLLIGIQNRDPFLVTESLDEGLHVMMQCYMRQHFVDLFWLHEHPERQSSRRREPAMRKFTRDSTT